MIKRLLHIPPKKIIIGTAIIIGALILFFSVMFIIKRPGGMGLLELSQSCKEVAKEYESIIRSEQIIYVKNCFIPTPKTIKVGDSVVFTNMSDDPMWVISEKDRKDRLKLNNFNSGQAWNKGESYGYTFTEKGKYSFSNKEKPSDKGQVAVE